MTVTAFATDIQVVCLGTLAMLLLYTLWLSRYRGLDAHVTVRWALIQGVAILAIITWRWLPIFGFTSKLQDRQLLLVMTVLFFAFVAFLMLDLLVRISRQTDQIKRLTQELAIQRLRIDGIVPSQVQSSQSSIGDASPLKAPRKRRGSRPIEVLACIWIVACVSFFYLEAAQYNSRFYPDCLRKLLTADYQG